MRFVTRLIEAVKIFLLIQPLEFFLHLRKTIDASIPMAQQLFRSDEVMKPDCFENILVNRSQGRELIKRLLLWLCQGWALHQSTFSVYRSGTKARQSRISVLGKCIMK